MRKIIDKWVKDGKVKGLTIFLRNYNNEFIIEYYLNETFNIVSRSRFTTKFYDKKEREVN